MTDMRTTGRLRNNQLQAGDIDNKITTKGSPPSRLDVSVVAFISHSSGKLISEAQDSVVERPAESPTTTAIQFHQFEWIQVVLLRQFSDWPAGVKKTPVHI